MKKFHRTTTFFFSFSFGGLSKTKEEHTPSEQSDPSLKGTQAMQCMQGEGKVAYTLVGVTTMRLPLLPP